jgi:L-asparaginase
MTERSPQVAVVFTGGTISMGLDPVAGGNVPSLDGAAILARTHDLDRIADVVPIDLGLRPASHFTFAEVLDVWSTVRTALARPEVSGAVIVQGTDTIEETSFVWDLLHGGPEPVVVTGAMRAPHEEGFDGPENLRGAVTIAATTTARDIGVVVSLAGTIEAADDVQKTHATSLTTFQSPDRGSLGLVRDGRVTLDRPRGLRRHVVTAVAATPVPLIWIGMDGDGALVRAAWRDGARGIVIAATGSGNTAPDVLAAAVDVIDAGIPVVLATRCPGGAVGAAYAFPGGGATWLRAGAIPAGHLCAAKARVALALGIGAGLDRVGLTDLLADPEPVQGADPLP